MALKLIELFGGIGACSSALTKLGIEYEIADYVEIDKYAVKSYNAIHGTNFEPQDITTWNKDIEVDLIMHGSPCQDFSLAGKQAGGDKDSGTRSSLMYETIRIVEKLKPKYVVWENVKNLLSKKHFHNFNAYLETMEELGYKSYYQVLNAKDYGVPQNRERVFTVSIRKDIDTGFVFPEKQPLKLKLKDMLENNASNDYYLTDYFLNQIRNTQYKKDLYIENTNKLLDGYYNDFKIMDYRYDEGLRIRKNNLCPTLTTRGKQSISGVPIIYNNKILRFITEKECWRLMGFDDEDFEKAEKVNSNTQLYKQAGNSIVVNVLMAILKELIK
jgi:DNA (cytosine-5)-methyltransferase 1